MLGLVGTIVLFSGGRSFSVAPEYIPGFAAAFVAAFVWAIYSVLSRRFAAVPSDAVVGFCLATALLAALFHLALEETVWPASAREWAAVAALGIGPVGAAFYAWDIGMKRGDIRVLGAASYAAPVLSTAFLVAGGFAQSTTYAHLCSRTDHRWRALGRQGHARRAGQSARLGLQSTASRSNLSKSVPGCQEGSPGACGFGTGTHQSGEAMVSMKTVLVPTEKSDLMNSTLETALLFAKRFDSYVEGFALARRDQRFRRRRPDRRGRLGGRGNARRRAGERGANAVRDLHAKPRRAAGGCRAADLSYGWTEADTARDAFVGSYGRVFDIIVFGRPGSYPAGSSMAAVEAALFESGRPILIAPPNAPAQLGENIVIAWNRSTETARCMAFAMPLLHRAKKVTVLTVTGGLVPGPEGSELARHLQRNGIAADAVHVEATNKSSGEVILQKAAELGCDLLIKGAYTQSRLRQMIFGGATSHILAKTDLPVFMAH